MTEPAAIASSPDPDPALASLIQGLRETARDRVFSATYNGRRIWVKTAGLPRLRSSVLMQRLIARLAGLPILLPPRNPSGGPGLRAEANALRDLRSAGFPVPEVVACTDQWLAMGDAGDAMEPRLHGCASDDERWKMIAATAALLGRLHAAGQWHGGAQIRNFSMSAAGPGLLDLEDHDLPGLSPAERQGRDLLLFLYSLTRFDRSPSAPRLSALAADMLAGASDDTRGALMRLRSRMGWLLALARLIAPWGGRDVRQAVLADTAIGAALAGGKAG